MVTTKRKRSDARRFMSLVVLFGIVALTIIGRLIWLQVVAAPAYAQKALEQRTQDIVLSPKRGAILDREGEPLARSVAARTVSVAPHAIEDRAAVAAALAQALGGVPADYMKKITSKAGFVYVERKVPVERALALQELIKKQKLKGIELHEDSRRVYPSGDLACQLLGFVGVDDIGLAGLELHYNDVLAGTSGRLICERDPFGYPIPGGVTKRIEPVDGQDIRLTVDRDIQYTVQVQLAATVKKYKAKGGQIVVMDPNTGAILAMASTPTFNPNEYRTAKPAAFRNRPASDAYEPGSTMKAVTAAAVIDRGLFTPTSKLKLPPTIRVGGRTIHESHSRGTVTWTLTDIVTHSSNIGAVKLGQALGPKGIESYFRRFGLLERTGVDFPGEAKGWMPAADQWSASTIGNVPFGQGVSVTALQLSRALAAIANGGELPTPHLLAEVPSDPERDIAWPKRRAIGEKASAEMTKVLAKVVSDGTGSEAAVPGYHVAGKTGTAQIPLSGGRGYATGRYVASFAGYLPAEDPQVLILVAIDEPKGVIYGGSVAAPAFREIAEFCVSHLRIPPPTADAP